METRRSSSSYTDARNCEKTNFECRVWEVSLSSTHPSDVSRITTAKHQQCHPYGEANAQIQSEMLPHTSTKTTDRFFSSRAPVTKVLLRCTKYHTENAVCRLPNSLSATVLLSPLMTSH